MDVFSIKNPVLRIFLTVPGISLEHKLHRLHKFTQIILTTHCFAINCFKLQAYLYIYGQTRMSAPPDNADC